MLALFSCRPTPRFVCPATDPRPTIESHQPHSSPHSSLTNTSFLSQTLFPRFSHQMSLRLLRITNNLTPIRRTLTSDINCISKTPSIPRAFSSSAVTMAKGEWLVIIKDKPNRLAKRMEVRT